MSVPTDIPERVNFPRTPESSLVFAGKPRRGAVGLAVFLLAVVLLLPGLATQRFSNRSEARIPLVALDIVRTGRILPPYLLGEPYLNKPPLHHLLVAGAIALFGRHDELVVRLPSVLCGAIAVWLTWILASRLAGGRAGIVAAAFLFLSYRFFDLARSPQLEILLAAATCLVYLGLLGPPASAGSSGERAGRGPAVRGCWLAAFGVAIASLTKGPAVALIFPFTLLLADAIVRRTARRLFSVGSLILILGAAAGTAIYYVPLMIELGGFSELKRRLAFENVLHEEGFHFYLWQFPLGLLPAGIALPWMIRALRKPDLVPRTFALGVAIGVLAFSLSASKQSHYLLPLYPLAAVWAGTSGVFERWSPRVIGVAFACLAAFLLGFVTVSEKSNAGAPDVMRRFSATARGLPIAMMERHPVLAYYLDRDDVEFPQTPAAAAGIIEERGGWVVVDVEKGETLAGELERFRTEKTPVEESPGHTYLLLGPLKSR